MKWFAVACGGLPASSLVTLPIVPNSGGDLWLFAVVCLLVIPMGIHHDHDARSLAAHTHSLVSCLGTNLTATGQACECISLLLYEPYANESSQICPFLAVRPQFESVHHQNRRLSSHSYSHESVIFSYFWD